ncbi:MAG: DUF116 domain-containing protein [Bacteroidetes bacterium]|nr:DUF116 domain-containing protein [Bacteroidota bacterium]
MEAPITYKLNMGQSASIAYYPVINLFTNKVLAKAEESIAPIANGCRRYIIEYELESPRSVEEYTYELLNLGVLWRTYGGMALSVRTAPFRLMAFLAGVRKKNEFIKALVDPIRGFLMSLFLARENAERLTEPPENLQEFERFVQWLEATGDFREDAFRFIRWLAYFNTLNPTQFNETMKKVLNFSAWFEKESLNSLGSYTQNVEGFLKTRMRYYRWREDRFVCLRTRVEYHLNMTGAEIMNRAFQPEFLSAHKKTVLVPGCMRLRSARKCEGIKTPNGILCTGCEPRCSVNRLRIMGHTNNFYVCILPHSTDLSRWAAKPDAPSHAVVGVACLSVLVQGGWELRRWNIPAQCVLLNECGCRKHWDNIGFPTELDVRELKKILQTDSPDLRILTERQKVILKN